jgi:carnitine 3-dehydrogenase
MGPDLTFHSAGRIGGIDHFLDQFAAPMFSWWETLGSPTLNPELRGQLAKGIADEGAGRSIAQLEARRDLFLVDLLARAESGAGIAADRRPGGLGLLARTASR